MAGFKLRAKVQEVGETMTVGQNGFTKREVIATIEGEYPDFFKFEFIKDKTSIPDELIEGTYVTFHFNLNGKKVESKAGKDPMYFTSLQCWKADIG
jgi:hypothetical protein